MLSVKKKNLGGYLRELEEKFGAYFPERANIEVERSLAGAPLLEKLSRLKSKLTAGGKVTVGKSSKSIKTVISIDGIKVVLEDDSWFLIRPSGTEPKVRFYVETRSSETLKDMIETADRLTRESLA